MIKLCEIFKDTFFKYYGDISPLLVIARITEGSKKYSTQQLLTAMNVARTSFVVDNEYYLEVYARICQLFLDDIKDSDELDKFIFDAIFITIYNNAGPSTLADFLGVRFKVRNIEQEVALEAYGSAQEQEIEKIRAISTEDAYSIQTPRPVSRDKWFYDLAVSAGSYAKCHSRKIGAVLVEDNSVISTGYNGPPRGIPTCDQRWVIDKNFRTKYGPQADGKETEGICPRRVIGFPSGKGLDICPAGHAERNALINAARLGIATKGTKIYMSCGLPCTPCLVEIINAGVEEIICSQVYPSYDETAMYVLENSDLKVRLYDFLV